MNARQAISFEFIDEEDALLLGGDAVSDWDDEDRLIGRLSTAELIAHKLQYREDVLNLERGHQSQFQYRHDPEYVVQMLGELFSAGMAFWRAVSNHDMSWLWNLKESLEDSFPSQWWLWQDSRDISQTVPCVETKGRLGALLPLDSLPLWPREKATITADEADARLLASYFAGYRSVVRYTPVAPGRFAHPPIDGARTTLYLRSTGVDDANEMFERLKRHAGLVLGPFPSAEGMYAAEDIARALLLPEPVLGSRPSIPDIVQVHAHAAEGRGFAQALMVTFEHAGTDTVLRSKHVQDLLDELDTLRRSGVHVDSGPIVLFNACQALGTIGREASSTGLCLALNGSRAIVGPREEVLSAYAVRFSEAIHEGLAEGQSVGRAVVRARWQTFADLLNPSGIFYATFGDVAVSTVDQWLPLLA